MRVHINLKFKDLIKIAIIGLFCFLVYSSCDKVDAKSLDFDSNYLSTIDITDSYSSISSNSVISNTYNEFKTWFDSQSVYTYYYYFIYTNSSSIDSSNIFLFTSYEESNEFFMWVRSFSQNVNTQYFRIETNNPPTTYYRVDVPYNQNFNSSNVYGPLTSPSDNIISSSNNKIILYDSNTPLYLGSYNLSNTFMLKLGNYYYGNRDIFPSVLDNNIPSLSFSNLTSFKNNLNNIYKYSVNLNYSNFDTSLYSYEYLLPNSSTWENVISNNYLLELYENGSYQFRIVDNSTNEVIYRNSLTITNIVDSSPFIDYRIEQIGSCLVPFNNSQLEICRRLTLIPSRYGSSYKFQYSLDNGNTWQYLFSDYRFLVEKNDVVLLRVLDSSDNLIWSENLSFEYLDSINSSLGITIVYNDTSNGLSENEKFFTEIYIYNLDSNYRDNVYISYDGGFNFELLSLENNGPYYLGISKNYLSNIILSIKILDSDDNIIFTSSHQVKINSTGNKDFLNYIESFNRSMSGPISSFITSPLRLVNMLNNTSTCEPLSLDIPHIGTASLPCMTNELNNNFPDILNIYQLITTGLIGYFCGLTIIKTIKTLVRPDDDRIEVVDL